MSDDGRLPPAWGPPPPPHDPTSTLAGLFAEPSGPPPPAPPDPALLAAQYQAQQEARVPPGRVAGAHRARRQPARYIIPAIIGALAVVAIVVGVSGWFRPDSTPVARPTASQVSVGTPTPTVSATPPTSHPPTASPTPTPTPTAKPTPSRTTPAPPPPPPALVHAPAVVLNETPIRGLAAQVAAELRTKGWTVTGTGNWHGDIGTTTVYYPRALAAAARRLAYDLGISRLRPVVPGMLTDRLTVVLTSNPYA